MVENHRFTIKILQTLLGNTNFSIKYEIERTSILYTKNIYDYHTRTEHFEQTKQLFHTYSMKNRKTHAFVLPVLNVKTEMEEIKDLESQKVSVKKNFRMKD